MTLAENTKAFFRSFEKSLAFVCAISEVGSYLIFLCFRTNLGILPPKSRAKGRCAEGSFLNIAPFLLTCLNTLPAHHLTTYHSKSRVSKP